MQSIRAKIKFNQRERILFTAIMASIIFSFFRFYYAKKRAVIKQNEKNIARMLNENKLNQKVLISLSENVTVIDDGKSIKKNYILKEGLIHQFVDALTEKTKKFGLTLKKLEFRDKIEYKGIKQHLFVLNVDSSFINIGKFLEDLNQLDYLFRVLSVEVHRFEKELKKCDAQILIYGYTKEVRQ